MKDDIYSQQLKTVEPDLVQEVFNRGFREGNRHSSPSPETYDRLIKLENDVNILTTAFIEHSKLKEGKLDDLMGCIKVLTEQIKRYEPMLENYNKGSLLAKLILNLTKYSAAAVIGTGAMVSAIAAVKHIFNGQN